MAEKIEWVKDPRNAAIDFVTGGGKYTLNVNKWLDAGPPSGGGSEFAYATGYATAHNVHYAPAKKGVCGTVTQTGQSFTIRDDYDFANPGVGGKGYHVNAQLGKEKVAFCYAGHSTADAYHDRVKMVGERYYFDGPGEAARWYTTRSG